MSDLLREAPLGQILRWVSGNKLLRYPEEEDGFQWPMLESKIAEKDGVQEAPTPSSESSDAENEKHPRSPAKDADQRSSEPPASFDPLREATSLTRTWSQRYTTERYQIEAQLELERSKSRPISPIISSDGTILVDWYTTDDPANPQNWSKTKKMVVLVQICLYTFAVYGSSSIYVSSEEGVMKHFGVGSAAAALGLAIYVIAYGLGPLIFAPMSEIPLFGRNTVYLPTFFLFVVLSIPTAVVKNYGGLIVLRFLQGFFGSPCLANGGATVGDMYSLLELPLYLSAWTAASFFGPALGPLISGFAVTAKGWRWSLWEIVWMTGPILVLFLVAFPETSSPNILLRRARRLRKLTGRKDIRAQSEIDQGQLSFSSVFWSAIIKPIEMTIKDPAIAFTNTYTALTYGIYYSFFEVFPLVYPPIYGFNLGEVGLCFVSIGVACLIGVTIFNSYLTFYLLPDIRKRGLRAPEHRLVPALFAVVTLPMGYFMFGWTARASVHWIVSIIGVVILVCSNFIIFQCVFVYIPLSYPQYTASLFAANDLFRSMFAAGCVMFSRPMFLTLGIGGGVSLLAGLAIVGIFGMWGLWKYGANLRARSTFAVS